MGYAFSITAFSEPTYPQVVNVRIEYERRKRPGTIRSRTTHLDLSYHKHRMRYRNLCMRVLPMFRSNAYAGSPFLGGIVGWALYKRALPREYGDA